MITISAFADEISPQPEEQIAVLLRHGIRHIEFRSIHGKNVLDLSELEHKDFRNQLRQNGFGLSAIGSPIGKIKITDPFEPHLERYEIALKLADFYQAERIRIFSFYMPEGDDPAIHRDEVVKRMKTLAAIAEKRGVKLFLENEKAIYGDTAERAHDLIHEVNSPALGHAFDPANYLEVGQDIDQAWSLLRPKVSHFHVKDYCTKTHKCVPAGQGEGQIAKLIADACHHGYRGFCTLEPHLVVAEKFYGFTGPERFGDAVMAFKSGLDAKNVPYA
ncbi:MAG: sugar phosphate isomerase/epimerase [Planctomycetota bacterium]|nr:MAG: sugar phosphate isomerase/epimerase [Planctomycetota bacterium]